MPLTPDITPSPFDEPPPQDPPMQELQPGFGIPRPGINAPEIDPSGRPFVRSTLIRGPFQLSAADPTQALEEYFARVEHPRTDPMGHGVLEADTPASLEESLLRPFYIGAALGAGALGRRSRYGENPLLSAAAIRAMKPPADRYLNIKGDLVKIPGVGGAPEVAYKGREASVSPVIKAQARVLEDQIKKMGAEYAKTQDPKRKDVLTRSLRSLNKQLADLLGNITPAEAGVSAPVAAAAQAPAQLPVALPESLDAANALDRMHRAGMLGRQQPFAFIGGGTNAPASTATNTIPKARRRYNAATGLLE